MKWFLSSNFSYSLRNCKRVSPAHDRTSVCMFAWPHQYPMFQNNTTISIFMLFFSFCFRFVYISQFFFFPVVETNPMESMKSVLTQCQHSTQGHGKLLKEMEKVYDNVSLSFFNCDIVYLLHLILKIFFCPLTFLLLILKTCDTDNYCTTVLYLFGTKLHFFFFSFIKGVSLKCLY